MYGHSEISIEYSLFIIVPLIRNRARMEQTGLIETSANVGIRSGNQEKQKAYRKNRAKNLPQSFRDLLFTHTRCSKSQVPPFYPLIPG